MPAARKAPARRPSPRAAASSINTDVTKALDALNEAIERAQTAAKSVRDDIARSSIQKDLVRNVETLMRDLRRDARKLDRAVRAEVRKAVGGSGTAARKPAAAAKKPATAAKKPAAKKPAAAAKKPAARKPAARKPTAAKKG